MGIERRVTDRVALRIPVELAEGQRGVTRNANSSGVFFECDEALATGSEIRFSLKFNNAKSGMICSCKALVVRVERSNGKAGIATRILESRFLPATAGGSELAHALH